MGQHEFTVIFSRASSTYKSQIPSTQQTHCKLPRPCFDISFFRALTASPQKLRNATFIIPSTRERVKRQITLRNPASFDGSSRSPVVGLGETEELLSWRRQSTAGDFWLAVQNTKDFLEEAFKWLRSPLGRGVLKCSLAYLLASMATYLRPVSNFLGKQDGKHVVATTVVYFHPARSAGSMLEANVYGILAFLYFLFISVSSMAVSVLCESQFNLIELGYTLVLVVFCGGGLGGSHFICFLHAVVHVGLIIVRICGLG